MALVRTADADRLPDEGSEDDATGPVLAKTKGFAFSDLLSDDEETSRVVRRKRVVKPDKPGSWKFDGHAVDGDETGEREEGTGLQDKIKERLREKQELEAEKSTKASKRKKQAKAADDEPVQPVESVPEGNGETEGTPEHLQTGIHFADLRLSRPLLRACSDLKFDSPTPIQRDVVPPALKGQDILATAETGSGKTASFLLPCLERLCQSASVRSRRRDPSGRLILGQVATKAVILIPTRELAVQCHSMLQNLAKYTMVTYSLVAGGYVARDQANSLRNQPDLVVATPGRLLDHLLNSQSVHMELLDIVVFDEADRLLEMGFRGECLEVLKRCSKGRQTMLFSATLNASVEDLAALALVKPVRVHSSELNAVAQTLEQEFVKAPSEELREAALLSLCSRNYTSKVIIFCSTKQAAHRLAIIFGLSGMKFAEIQGNLQQVDRVKALKQFQNGEADFLIATDLASRGLDMPGIKTVINFHLPLDVTRYIHRVGRTARMGRSGRAVTLYIPEEYAKVKQLGRQCCTKVKSKVLKRTVAADAIQTWAEKIDGYKEDIAEIMQEEDLDKELRLADLLAGKSDNLQKHKKDIQARPAKEWFMTNKDKQKLKEDDNKRVKDVEAKTLADPELEKGKKKRKGPLTEEELEAKKRKQLRDRLTAKKEEKKAERAKEEAKSRAAAKRFKRGAMPVKGGDAPKTVGERIHQQKMERKKKKAAKKK
mmetsp:Transcript_22200/g.39996  ORF Transcript_22200/g.39996 Transcript_22200/m.39996 type:complete len:714 (-) Transcript_22200:86-2227(-)|eukprot:CAMPEP_0197701526 /NCGR_PEP_ID=MMETSP1338-20131121/123350_1 /TAXON_ID=43686 ORGANISM="Pelagodinium beii, Strain RCC1491" /NCGR_SAMPLE_ID=MMETSP1338 /ASSEMBLY_ACC=CAM_ASM_000754 /LENGTH=713 /DNA_ID=CAMNT_0043285231 /DNA_START=11 /DNA_END=2152 /DNA_ORIENTATION=+